MRSAPKPVTPFAGLVSFLKFLHRLALPEQLAANMLFQLRSGNTSSARGVVEFLQEALALLPTAWRVRTVRANGSVSPVTLRATVFL